MHKNEKMQMNFRVLRQSFCGKFKLSAGSGSQVSQLLDCMLVEVEDGPKRKAS